MISNRSRNYVQTEIDEIEEIHEIRNLSLKHKSKKVKPVTPIKYEKPLELKLVEEAIEQDAFKFSYQASRHEKEWIMDSLKEFYEQKWFEDILSLVKGGKEATVYLCRAPENMETTLLAAKVYRPRMYRNLKNDHIYREGRDAVDADGKIIHDDRSHHAMQKKSSYGMELIHNSWVGHEFKTLKLLYKAGVDIPKPFASCNNAIMMGYMGDENIAAPTLNSVTLTTTEARILFQRVIHNIVLMLDCNRVHADLSAYNILYWNGEISLIDFPQSINPNENQNSYKIFCRDVLRVCEYFSSQGVKTDPVGLAYKLWKSKGLKTKPEFDLNFLDPEKTEDRLAWENRE